MLFSLAIYRFLSTEIDRFSKMQQIRFERRIQGMMWQNYSPQDHFLDFSDPELVVETKTRIVWILLMVNGWILIVAGGMAYVLAGKTLRPIQDMVDDQLRFVSDASHELRTPLTAMKISMEVGLRDKTLTLDEAKKIIKENINDVDRLKKLSDALLSLAMFENKGTLDLSSISLSKVAKNSVEKFGLLAKAKGMKLAISTKTTRIKAEETSATELVNILIDNAIKYGSENSTISVKVFKTNNFGVLRIKNAGNPLSKVEQRMVFERFYRSDKSRSQPGNGLGLAIAKKIVEKYGGQILARSDGNKYNTFEVKLPLA